MLPKIFYLNAGNATKQKKKIGFRTTLTIPKIKWTQFIGLTQRSASSDVIANIPNIFSSVI